MIANARCIAADLGARLGEGNVAFHLFRAEDHASVLMVAIQRLLRVALAPAEACDATE